MLPHQLPDSTAVILGICVCLQLSKENEKKSYRAPLHMNKNDKSMCYYSKNRQVMMLSNAKTQFIRGTVVMNTLCSALH